MKTPIIIYWLRQDLRIADNPALHYAANNGTVLPVYIWDEVNSQEFTLGAASKVWLHYSLQNLNQNLENKLAIYTGNPLDILLELCIRYKITQVVWNRCYEPWQINRDKNIKHHLMTKNIQVTSFNASLLWEPWEIQKKDGSYYKVFTPFYRNGCLQATPPRQPLAVPREISYFQAENTLAVEDLSLLPTIDWYSKTLTDWQIGEQGAQQKLWWFVEKALYNYKEGRNLPAKRYTSLLAPHLHFGEISPNQIWYVVKQLPEEQNIDCFCSELGWREFSYSQIYFNSDLPWQNLQRKFDKFPWQHNQDKLRAWQRGMTGIPIVDAGMRELWQTGYMHNRVRMIVGSFLVKNLLIDWRYGAKWFWDCLFDADLANNSASWQWIAGCGADAAPYFRIFNPITQGEKFDPDGEYIRKYIPELRQLPTKYIFNPIDAPSAVLKNANIILGDTYPMPIVDIKESRQQALDAFKALSAE